MKVGFKRAWGALLSWPRPPGGQRRQVACHFCDTLHYGPPVREGMGAYCVRCSTSLYQNRPASLVRASAFSLAALALLVLVHSFPMLSMEVTGLTRRLTLINSASALIHADAPLLGISILLFTVVAPVILLAGMAYVCLPLLIGRAAPGSPFIAKWVYRTEPWNMIEVFLLGVLVSLLKLDKVADVHFNIGFWALGAVMFCLAAAIAGIDRQELWDRLEVARK